MAISAAERRKLKRLSPTDRMAETARCMDEHRRIIGDYARIRAEAAAELVAECGSKAAAARRLGITQAAVAKLLGR